MSILEQTAPDTENAQERGTEVIESQPKIEISIKLAMKLS